MLHRRGYRTRKQLRYANNTSMIPDFSNVDQSEVLKLLWMKLEDEIHQRRILEEAVRTLWDVLRGS
jgi:hypothetical protein